MIKLDVTKSVATVRQNEMLISGSVNIYLCQFNFSSDWNGLDITAIFQAGSTIKEVVLGYENVCKIPWEVLEKSGVYLNVGFRGSRASEVILQPTTMTSIGLILPGAPNGNPSVPPTPDIVDQILEEAMLAVDVAKSVRIDADAGRFDGATGKDGVPGPQGETGPQGPEGAAGQSAYAAAQAGGYTGTESEFYADLAAMDGLAAWFAAL